jgi:hypothetical protein
VNVNAAFVVNTPPVAAPAGAVTVAEKSELTIDVSSYFSDADIGGVNDDKLEYTVSIAASVSALGRFHTHVASVTHPPLLFFVFPYLIR